MGLGLGGGLVIAADGEVNAARVTAAWTWSVCVYEHPCGQSLQVGSLAAQKAIITHVLPASKYKHGKAEAKAHCCRAITPHRAQHPTILGHLKLRLRLMVMIL